MPTNLTDDNKVSPELNKLGLSGEGHDSSLKLQHRLSSLGKPSTYLCLHQSQKPREDNQSPKREVKAEDIREIYSDSFVKIIINE